MLRQIIVMFSWIICFYLPSVQAQQPPVTAPGLEQIKEQAGKAPKRGILYKISNNAHHTLFLFGTIHVGQPDFYPLESTLVQAASRASNIALEIDPQHMAGMQQAMQRYGLYPANAIVPLPPALETRVKDLAQKSGMSYDNMRQMKPWMISIILALREVSAAGFQSGLAADLYLSNFAHAQNKNIVELESIESQLALFDSMPPADQVRALEETINEIENETTRRKLTDMVNAWRHADIAALDAIANEVQNDNTLSGKFTRDVILNGRNPGLANGIERLLKNEKNAFAGIGMLHLLGKDSVPALLKQRGYSVERVY